MIPRTPLDNKDSAIRAAHSLARERYAGEHARIDKAALIARNGGVILHSATYAQVRSDRDPSVYYEVTKGKCDCPDSMQAPGFRCKHVLAVAFIKIALAIVELG